MKKINLLSLFFLFSFLLSPSASAVSSSNTKLTAVVILKNGIQIETVAQNRHTCGNASGNRWFIGKDHPSYDELYAAALAALHNEREVAIFGPTGQCQGTRALVNYLFAK